MKSPILATDPVRQCCDLDRHGKFQSHREGMRWFVLSRARMGWGRGGGGCKAETGSLPWGKKGGRCWTPRAQVNYVNLSLYFKGSGPFSAFSNLETTQKSGTLVLGAAAKREEQGFLSGWGWKGRGQ